MDQTARCTHAYVPVFMSSEWIRHRCAWIACLPNTYHYPNTSLWSCSSSWGQSVLPQSTRAFFGVLTLLLVSFPLLSGGGVFFAITGMLPIRPTRPPSATLGHSATGTSHAPMSYGSNPVQPFILATIKSRSSHIPRILLPADTPTAIFNRIINPAAIIAIPQ